MPVNLTSLKADLTAKIAALDSTATPEELLLLAASVNNATNDRIITVETVNDLPDLQTGLDYLFPSGTIFYVKSVNTLVVSSNARWIGFDNRILRSDATVFSAITWGSNSEGQLGTADLVSTSFSSPVTVVGGITNWSQISTDFYTVGVTTAGVAYAWGSNSYGALGDGTTTNRSSPVSVIGGITNWKQIEGSRYHSVGVTSTGVAYAWGRNSDGRLGDGTTINRTSPVTVVGGITNWNQVSTGSKHSVGVTTTGIAYAWGLNSSSQLGDGTTTARSSPVTVVGGITNWKQLSAGNYHNLGITSTGVAYAWGANSVGQLGDGTTTARSSPVTVVGGITNWNQVSAGANHSLGVTATGIAYAWGFNSSSQLGDGTTTARSSPVTVVGGITNWKQLSAGSSHSLGVTIAGVAYAWGSNYNGRLGDGTTTARSSPVTVVGGITNWNQVSAGTGHSAAIRY